jgi:hypothetical protein
VNIHHDVHADAYNPAHASASADFLSAAAWNAVGRDSLIQATSESHPFDPPPNVATASSRFTQSSFGNATLRERSFVHNVYSGIGDTAGYAAGTTFSSQQDLLVRTGGSAGGTLTFRLVVPMHGVLAGRGNSSTNGSGDAHAEMSVRALRGGVLLDETVGTLDFNSTEYNTYSWNATGDWVGDVTVTTTEIPSFSSSGTDTVPAVELLSFELLQLGSVPTASATTFGIELLSSTSAVVTTSGSKYALADFSATGGYEIQAFDAAGNRFYDFSVGPVPEPASLAAIGIGPATLVRRRRVA